MPKNNYVTDCALCGSGAMKSFGDLINSPLANNLYADPQESKISEKFPLGLCVCESCQHFQLSYEVDSKKLFSNYTYKSGISKSFRHHFEQLSSIIWSNIPDKNKIGDIILN